MAKARAKTGRVLKQIRELCLALPDTKETLTWGKPHFRVGEKIFCGYGEENGVASLGFKLEAAHARAIVADPRFWKAPYVGHKGWVSMDANSIEDWEEVRSLILESYKLIAPKRSIAKLEVGAHGAASAASAKPRSQKSTARRAKVRER